MCEDENYRPQPPAASGVPMRKPRRSLQALALALAAFACAPHSEALAAVTALKSTVGSSEFVHQPTAHSSARSAGVQSADDFSAGHASVLRIDSDARAEQIFLGVFVTAQTDSSISKDSQSLDVLSESGLLSPTQISAPVDLRGQGLSSTISALQSGVSNYVSVKKSASPAFLAFWDDSEPGESEANASDAAEAMNAAAGAASERPNVLIPLPAAIQSGLSVMCGVSLMAGVRRLRRRLR